MNMNLQEILRYGVSGGFGLLVFFLCFKVPGIETVLDGKFLAFELLIVLTALVVGSLIYAGYRAFAYQPLFWLAKTIAGRTETNDELDIKRWETLNKEDPLYDRLSEWGAQIHLLNTSAFAGVFFIILGNCLGMQKTLHYSMAIPTCAALLVLSLISNCRYQCREKRVLKK